MTSSSTAVEGSTLGGQIIARLVYKHLGLTHENGCQFFSSYGAAVGPMWKSFGQQLATWCAANKACRGEIIRSAASLAGWRVKILFAPTLTLDVPGTEGILMCYEDAFELRSD